MPRDVDKLKARRDRLNAQLRQLQGRQKRDERKQENRRKILAGAFLLEQAARDPAVHDWMMQGFGWFLTRDDERALFDLPLRLVTDNAEAKPTSAMQAAEFPGELRRQSHA